MRKTARMIRDKNNKLPDDCKKVDTSVNGDAETLVEEHKEVEKGLHPLRIDKRTVILVTKDKLTPEYADMMRNKMHCKGSDSMDKNRCGSRIMLNVEELRRMVDAGMKIKEMACEMGVSRTSISNYINNYKLRDGKG